MSEKYIRVEELKEAFYEIPISPKSRDKIFSLPTYTPADILAGMWVPVTERLPEDGDYKILVCCNFHGKIVVEDRKAWNIDGSVTHWMPLPKTEGLHET